MTKNPFPNPKRVAAGRLNRMKRKGLTPEGRDGPRTPEGKAKVARNGKARQLGTHSLREIRTELAKLNDLIRSLRETRAML